MASSSRSSRSPRSPNVGNTIQPYRMHVSQRYLDLTRQKLELTRLPREPQGSTQDAWSYGVAKSNLEPLIDHWVEDYDWRAQEAYYNDALPQYRIGLNGTRLHFVHRRAQSAAAIPLLFVHGWPESFIVVSHMIEALCNPVVSPNRMDNGTTAFHVVTPSIPGFGFSDPVHEDGNNIATTAELFDSLMKTLGYTQYIAHGSGWGFRICRMLALNHPESCLAIHTANPDLPAPNPGFAFAMPDPSTNTMPMVPPAMPMAGAMQPPRSPMQATGVTPPLTPGGLQLQHSDRPQTISYALCDSPAGLLAHVLDTIRPRLQSPHASPRSAADNSNPSLHTPWTPTAIVTWAMLHWLPGPEVALRWLANSAPIAQQSLWASHSNVPLAISLFGGGGGGHHHHHPAAQQQMLLWAEAYHRVALVRRKPEPVAFPAWERPIDLVLDLRELAGIVGPALFGVYVGA